MADFIGAIDGGGSKTLAAVAGLDGTTRIVARAAGCNPQDNPEWRLALTPALAALKGAAAITLGMPGYGEVATLDTLIADEAAALAPAPLTILNDVEMAALGAFPEGEGVLILAGTGSMAMAVSGRGLFRSGGWGDGFGDEGSGHWIGREALSRVSKMLDGRLPESPFAAALCGRLGPPATERPFGPMAWLLNHPHGRSALASVARHVDALAETGDATAQDILTRAAEELWLAAKAAARLAGLPPSALWAGAGSVLQSRTITTALTARMGHPPLPPALPPLGGGLALAARAAGWETGPAFAARLNQSLTQAMESLP